MRYLSQGKQMSIDEFRSSLSDLNKSNRWVKLGDALPWDRIEQLYNKQLGNSKRGAANKPARMIIGALLIKHKMNLSDQETILAIQENPYMQYFVGLSEFTDKPIFDSSLFVTIRKRLGTTVFNDMSVELLHLQVEQFEANNQAPCPKKDQSDDDSDNHFIDSNGVEHRGSLKIDATCADAEVRYPTDIDLLHDGCKVINRYTDKLCKGFALARPISHYQEARSAYLEVIKRKRKPRSLIRQGKNLLLNYLIRDVRSFINLIAVHGSHLYDSLKCYERRTAGAILEMYHQQQEMFKTNTHTCKNRIISIFQPHIRPIVRGKSKSPTEFGAKLGASIVRGYTFIDRHSWEAYNESSDLSLQIQLYYQRFGFLPAKVFADKIYMNKKNRILMKELEIKAMGKPLGRPPKIAATPQSKAQTAKSVGERNEIEATFGTAKRVYRANNIRAKLPQTAACWTALCYFVKNVMRFLKELLCALFQMMFLVPNLYNIFKIKILELKYGHYSINCA